MSLATSRPLNTFTPPANLFHNLAPVIPTFIVFAAKAPLPNPPEAAVASPAAVSVRIALPTKAAASVISSPTVFKGFTKNLFPNHSPLS